MAAPQAALISAIAQGVLGGTLDWGLIGRGAMIGAVVIAIDEVLRARKLGSLPPLAVGMGMYLPLAVTAMIVVGAVLGHFYNRWAHGQRDPGFAERLGVLAATGLIVGDSLFNVGFAGMVAATGNIDVLAVTEPGAWTTLVGLLAFGGAIAWLYSWTRRKASLPIS